MSWWKSIFASGDEQKKSEPQLTQLQRLSVERAVLLMEIINESLQLANNSTNPSTKVSRLELARAKLDSLELIAGQHPFIKLQRLDAVRRTIAQLAEEFTKAGYYALTDESCREYRQSFLRGINMPVEDIIKGCQFMATMQLRTPLRVLNRHGEVHHGLTEPPTIAHEQWEGHWSPKLKTLSEILEVPGLSEFDSMMASDVGLIPKSGGEYINFLKRVRSIVEMKCSIDDRKRMLSDELRKPEWADYCARLGGKEAVCCKFFPPFIGTITGLSDATVKALWTLGLITPDALSLATDTELLAIKGIGPAKLKAIRAASANAQHPASEFVDNVAL